jgi:outer membrane usher protein FimD/PapC
MIFFQLLKQTPMKKNIVSIFLGLMVLSIMSSCFHHHHHDLNISLSDDEDEYEMDADYRNDQTHAVQVYLNDRLLSNSTVSVKSDLVDKEITLDDNTTFYINSNPGSLNIKFDKSKNSAEACERLRQVCEELKDILAEN